MGIRAQNCVIRDVKCGHFEFLEHNLRHTLAVLWSIPWSFCHNDRMVGRVDFHLVDKRVRYYMGYGAEVAD